MNERVTATKQGRLGEATQYLAEQRLDGLIAASNGLNNFLEANAVFVLSGVRPMGESAVVLDRDGRATLIVTPAWDEPRAASLSATERTVGTDDLAATLKGVVGSHRLDLSRTLSAGLSMLGAALHDRIAVALGGLPAPADELARELARIRTPEELAAAERARRWSPLAAWCRRTTSISSRPSTSSCGSRTCAPNAPAWPAVD